MNRYPIARADWICLHLFYRIGFFFITHFSAFIPIFELQDVQRPSTTSFYYLEASFHALMSRITFCLINTTLKLALHYPNNPEASVSDFYHERKVSDSHQDLEANTYQLPLSHSHQLARRAKKRPGTDSQESAPRRLTAGALPTVKYSYAKRQLKNLARSLSTL